MEKNFFNSKEQKEKLKYQVKQHLKAESNTENSSLFKSTPNPPTKERAKIHFISVLIGAAFGIFTGKVIFFHL